MKGPKGLPVLVVGALVEARRLGRRTGDQVELAVARQVEELLAAACSEPLAMVCARPSRIGPKRPSPRFGL